MTTVFSASGSVLIAGFAAPGMVAGALSSHSELVRYLRERVREREGAEVAVHTVYVPDQRGVENVVVGVPRPQPIEVPVGDVYVVVPPATYAVFTPDPRAPDPVDELWNLADAAELSGVIERVAGPSFEIDQVHGTPELWIPVRLR